MKNKKILEWEEFYKRFFGLDVDFDNIKTVGRAQGLLIIPPAVNLNLTIEIISRLTLVDVNVNLIDIQDERSAADGAYSVIVEEILNPAKNDLNKTAAWVQKNKILTQTLLERLVYGLKFYDETDRFLDTDFITLCCGSRIADDNVPAVEMREQAGAKIMRIFPRAASEHEEFMGFRRIISGC